MRTYIIGNDGITLSREAPAAANEGEIAVASKDILERLEPQKPQPIPYTASTG